MTLKYRTIGLTSRSDMPDKEETVERIARIVEKAGGKLCIDAKRCNIPKLKGYPSMDHKHKLDAILVIGGDGTILRTIREMHDLSVPLLSINKGRVGFLTEVDIDEVDEMIPKLLEGKGTIELRNMLSVIVTRDKKKIFEGNVLNEAAIAQGAIARIIDLKATVNDEPLATFHADGVIIATPTGSTAYSLSAGGPVVHPALHATIVTPINPYSFSQKPIVLAANSVIAISIITKQNKFSDVQVSLTLDGQTYVSLKRSDHLRITQAKEHVRFLRRREDTFIQTLRTKLKWGEGRDE